MNDEDLVFKRGTSGADLSCLRKRVLIGDEVIVPYDPTSGADAHYTRHYQADALPTDYRVGMQSNPDRHCKLRTSPT